MDFISQSMRIMMPGGGGGGPGPGPPGPGGAGPGPGGAGPGAGAVPPELVPPIVLPLGALCPNGMQPGTLATFEPGFGQIGVPTFVQTVALVLRSKLQWIKF